MTNRTRSQRFVERIEAALEALRRLLLPQPRGEPITVRRAHGAIRRGRK